MTQLTNARKIVVDKYDFFELHGAYLGKEAAVRELAKIEDDQATLLNCYKALLDATEINKGTSLGNLLNAWIRCQKEMNDGYVSKILKACTYVLLRQSLVKINAEKEHIDHVTSLACEKWREIQDEQL